MTGCDRVFYYPDQKVRTSPADAGLDYEDVHFQSGGFRLHGWFLPAAGGDAKGTVLHLHGNAANVTGHWEFVRWLPAAGYNVLTFDYRGYGRSEGRVTRAGTIEDAHAALDYLQSRPNVDAGRIVVWAQSIGGAIGVVLAAERREDIRGIVVEGAFSSYRDIVRYHVLRHPLLLVLAWWYPFFVDRTHDPIDCVDRIAPTPVLFIHGKADRVVPHGMSQELYEKANQPKDLWLVEGADHYEIWEDGPEMAQARLLEFLDRALAGSGAQ